MKFQLKMINEKVLLEKSCKFLIPPPWPFSPKTVLISAEIFFFNYSAVNVIEKRPNDC